MCPICENSDFVSRIRLCLLGEKWPVFVYNDVIVYDVIWFERLETIALFVRFWKNVFKSLLILWISVCVSKNIIVRLFWCLSVSLLHKKF